MNILETLNQKCRERGLEFLVMGGLATIAHGHQRQTIDIDLLACSAQRKEWESLMGELGYQVFHEHGTFIQFSPPQDGLWPVDLMFVNESTFAKMNLQAVEVRIQAATVHIPSVEHLIALKLHALKHASPRREMKDLLDVAGLIEANHIDINGTQFAELCRTYGSKKIKAQIAAICSK